MANSDLFNTRTAAVPQADVENRAGGRSYSFSKKHALAQYAATGMFGSTYYASAREQLDVILDLAKDVDTKFLSQVAIYSRNNAFLKDMPALLLAVLSTRDSYLFSSVFPHVIDNGKMLRNFVQIMRSGVVGRTSLGTAPKREIKKWLANREDDQIFKDSVGNNPSLADIIKMVHPKPDTKVRENLYNYLITGEYDGRKKYPSVVKEFEDFKKGKPGNRYIPNVPFQLLTSQSLTTNEWKQIATNAQWHMTRMNLNTFSRNLVFRDSNMVDMLSNRLRSEQDIAKAKVYPYQIFTAYNNIKNVPQKICGALHDAMEIATENVPAFPGKVFVAVDCSGSMGQSVGGSGIYGGNPVTCNAVASLIASSVLRNNEDTEVFCFDTDVYAANIDPRDTVVTNARILNRRGGGTDVSCVMRHLNEQKREGDLVIIISDNESWLDFNYFNEGTGLTNEWDKFRRRNKNAKLVCVDLCANEYTQAPDREHTLNVGGFSDRVFNVIDSFLKTDGSDEYWVKHIESQFGYIA